MSECVSEGVSERVSECDAEKTSQVSLRRQYVFRRNIEFSRLETAKSKREKIQEKKRYYMVNLPLKI